MKTDELLITQSPQVMEKVLDKIEYIALYTGMIRRDASSMRLMAEELLSATKGILAVYEGRLWMETSDEQFTLHVRVEKPREKAKRDQFTALSKSGKVTPPKGLFARLGAAIEALMLLGDSDGAPVIFTNYAMYTGDMIGMHALYTYHYLPKADAKEKEEPDPLAGIEKNIIDAIVDDILVTVYSDSVEIIAVKNL